MGKQKLLTGILLGATAGGLMTLMDQDVRKYTKQKLVLAKSHSVSILKNPSAFVQKTRITFDQYSHKFHENAASAQNALEQIEETVQKVTNRTKCGQNVIEMTQPK